MLYKLISISSSKSQKYEFIIVAMYKIFDNKKNISMGLSPISLILYLTVKIRRTSQLSY